MKVLIGAAAAALLLCGAAAAQETTLTPGPGPAVQVPPSRCGDLPGTPTAPDGADATSDAMQAAMASFTAWEASYRGILECRRTEAREAQALSEQRTSEFNSGVTSFNATVASWTTEVEEFNARQPRRNRR